MKRKLKTHLLAMPLLWMIYFKKVRRKKIMVSFFFFFWDREDWVWEEGWAELKVLFCLGATGTSGVGGGVYTVDKKGVKREIK